MPGKLIIFSAPSGAGKTTIVRYLLSRISRLQFSVSATTRGQREGEIDGVDYHFLSKEEFLHRVAKKQFVEFEEVYSGTFYGTLRSELESHWNAGKQVILDMDVVGALHLKKKYTDSALAVFVKPPSISVLKERLTGRATESDDKIQERIRKAVTEMEYESSFDVAILNDHLDEACKQAEKFVLDFLLDPKVDRR